MVAMFVPWFGWGLLFHPWNHGSWWTIVGPGSGRSSAAFSRRSLRRYDVILVWNKRICNTANNQSSSDLYCFVSFSFVRGWQSKQAKEEKTEEGEKVMEKNPNVNWSSRKMVRFLYLVTWVGCFLWKTYPSSCCCMCVWFFHTSIIFLWCHHHTLIFQYPSSIMPF